MALVKNTSFLYRFINVLQVISIVFTLITDRFLAVSILGCTSYFGLFWSSVNCSGLVWNTKDNLYPYNFWILAYFIVLFLDIIFDQSYRLSHQEKLQNRNVFYSTILMTVFYVAVLYVTITVFRPDLYPFVRLDIGYFSLWSIYFLQIILNISVMF